MNGRPGGPWRGGLFFHPIDTDSADSKPLVGCSACLIGEPVRYDGTHNEQPQFARHLLPWLHLQAICPEVGIGLGVPRPTLKVVDSHFGDGGQRVVHVENPADDVTDALLDYADSYARRIGRFWPLSAYIFKARSPSCGVGSAPVNPGQANERRGDGAFAGRFRLWAPWLPLYQEEDLQDGDTCREMLLLAYLCRDILWRGGPAPDVAGQARHYQDALGLELGAGTALGSEPGTVSRAKQGAGLEAKQESGLRSGLDSGMKLGAEPGAKPESAEALWIELLARWRAMPASHRRERIEHYWHPATDCTATRYFP